MLYRNLKPKLAIMHQCTSVTDRRTLKRKMYILHHALKMTTILAQIQTQSQNRYRIIFGVEPELVMSIYSNVVTCVNALLVHRR